VEHLLVCVHGRTQAITRRAPSSIQPGTLVAERKSSRLIELLTLLLTHRYGVGIDEIRRLRGYPKGADAFHRQFERDKELLRDMGFVVVAREDPDDSSHTFYYLDRGRSLLREVEFTPEELAALALARKLTAHLPLVGEAVREGLSRAGEPTLEEFAPAGVICPPPAATGKREQARLHLIERAVAADHRLTIRYHALGDAKAVIREVDPYALYLHGGAWYLMGHCHLRKSPRVFRVSRISEAKRATRGKLPDFTLPKDFHLEDYLDRFPFELGRGTSGEVTVRFGPHQVWRMGAGLGRRGRVTREADGAIRLRLDRVNPEGLISWVLGMGRDVQVISPKGLKYEVGQAARRVAERHAARRGSR
jgi:proteasome accessory factor B